MAKLRQTFHSFADFPSSLRLTASAPPSDRVLRVSNGLPGLALQRPRFAFGLRLLVVGGLADALLDVADGFIGETLDPVGGAAGGEVAFLSTALPSSG